MAFIDTSGNVGAGASVYGGINPGAPSGGGVANNVPINGAPGSSGLGSGLSIKSWVLIYYGFIIVTLFATGVIFNGKGKASS
jgi:hypothetical protein